MEFRAVLEVRARSGALKASDLDTATRFVAMVLGPGLTDVILQELGAELHEVLASDALRKRLNLKRRRALARLAVLFIRNGLGLERKTE